MEESSGTRISEIVHLVYMALLDLPSFVHSLWLTYMLGQPYTSIQRSTKMLLVPEWSPWRC